MKALWRTPDIERETRDGGGDAGREMTACRPLSLGQTYNAFLTKMDALCRKRPVRATFLNGYTLSDFLNNNFQIGCDLGMDLYGDLCLTELAERARKHHLFLVNLNSELLFGRVGNLLR